MLYEVVIEGNASAWFKHFGAAQNYIKYCTDSGLKGYFQLVDKHVESTIESSEIDRNAWLKFVPRWKEN